MALFNEHGVRTVTMNHIAAKMGISPGNLYYHYANREEIVLALFSRIETAAPVALAPFDGEVTVEHWVERFMVGINVVWDYRFLFSNLTELTGRDPTLRRRARRVARWIIDAVVDLLDVLVAAGKKLPPAHPDEHRRLGETWYILYWNWPSFIRLTRGERAVRTSDILEGALQSHQLFEPYLDPSFAAAARTLIEAKVDARRRSRRGHP